MEYCVKCVTWWNIVVLQTGDRMWRTEVGSGEVKVNRWWGSQARTTETKSTRGRALI